MAADLSPTSSAPGDLEFVRRFLNTLDLEAGTDDLSSPKGATRWLREHGSSVRIDASAHRQLIAIRGALREVVRLRGTPQEERAAASLEAIARRYPVVLRATGSAILAPSSTGGVGAVIERILGLVAVARIDGTWGRLKSCANGDCAWVYFDRSRNRSRTWCTMELCGSRAKMRAYRSRRRAATPSAPSGSGATARP
jgi:predicted RNA-binding Zn ribbon-like protein